MENAMIRVLGTHESCFDEIDRRCDESEDESSDETGEEEGRHIIRISPNN